MEASVIWYRARSGGELTTRLNEFIRALDTRIISENSTIEPSAIPQLLVKALKSSDITVIIGGLDLIHENENIIYILSKCLSLRLEKNEKSRSRYIYDTLRGRVLPSFESAVLFPSEFGGPEGMAMFSGDKTIIILPWMERQHFDILSMMQNYLPDALSLYESAEEEEEIVEVENESALPDYIERAAARHRPPPIKPDEELNSSQLRSRLLYHDDANLPEETNHRPLSQRRNLSKNDTSTEPQMDIMHLNREKKSTFKTTPIFRITAVIFVLAVIIGTCCVAFFYEPGLYETPEAYQSELALLYNDTILSENLPQFALPEFSQLYDINPNTRGYIYIPDTALAQPIVQSEPGSSIYSGLDFYNNADQRGTLYFDSANKITFGSTNNNLIVYGSSPADGSMFSVLQNYTNAEFLTEHPIICMDTLFEKAQWKIFSVCIVSGDTISEFNYANTEFIGEHAKYTHLYNLNIRSIFYTETDVFPTDELLTLVTDSSAFTGAKLLVCARKIRTDEDPSADTGSAIANELVLMPDIWYSINDAEIPSVPALQLPTSMRETITALNWTDEYGNPIYVSEHTESAAATTTTTTAAAAQNSDSAVTTTTQQVSSPTTIARPTKLANMRITSGGTVITGSAEEILAMIIEAEMGSDYSLEALKAQAVASYTYYLYSGGSAKAPSFPTKAAGSRALEAANAVTGQYLTYKGNVPYTPYFAISAGQTANNTDINGSELSYLTSVDCSVDEAVGDFRTVREVNAADVAARVLDKKGIDLNQISDKNQWFQILERDANNLYVTKVSVGGKAYKGNTLHLSILGYSCLRSPCFWIEYNAESDKFIFTSQGYGTGVGMSQSGANEYAKQGYNYVWILQHFYTGLNLTAG